jgi:hypothetical protein
MAPQHPNIPEGGYDISIYGESSASIISLSVMASQNTMSDEAGLYSVNASSRGLPHGTYWVTANGVHIADVYLTARSPPSYVWTSIAAGQGSWTELLPYVLLVITILVLAFIAVDIIRRKRKK